MVRIVLTCVLGAVVMVSLTLPKELRSEQDTPAAKIISSSQESVCVVRVGTESFSGFVISHEPLLVVTVGHSTINVKDPTDMTVQTNDKGTVMTVKAFHVHPDFKKDQGGKNPFSPDVAVLELDPSEEKLGPPLVLFSHKSGVDLRGAEIVSLGFPSYATPNPRVASPTSVARKGLIRRMVNYDFTTKSPLLERPMLEHDLAIVSGESGAPILLVPSGKVVGVQHGIRRILRKDTSEVLATLPVAIHVDELWSLIDHAKLTKALQR